jgi:hypothetical protein
MQRIFVEEVHERSQDVAGKAGYCSLLGATAPECGPVALGATLMAAGSGVALAATGGSISPIELGIDLACVGLSAASSGAGRKAKSATDQAAAIKRAGADRWFLSRLPFANRAFKARARATSWTALKKALDPAGASSGKIPTEPAGQ